MKPNRVVANSGVQAFSGGSSGAFGLTISGEIWRAWTLLDSHMSLKRRVLTVSRQLLAQVPGGLKRPNPVVTRAAENERANRKHHGYLPPNVPSFFSSPYQSGGYSWRGGDSKHNAVANPPFRQSLLNITVCPWNREASVYL